MDGDARSASKCDIPDDFKILGAATRAITEPKPSKDAGQDACTICLELISERAVAVPCNHLTFDFLCLVSWLQEQSTCPLCKADITAVQYDWRSPDDYKTYHVPKETEKRPVQTQNSRQRTHIHPDLRRRRQERRDALQSQITTGADSVLERRRHIYRNRLYALRVGANRVSQYRDFTAQDFAASNELQSRARTFLRRELQLFTFLDANPRGGNRDFLVEYVVAVLKANELRGADGKAEELLKDFLGLENTRQLLHELDAWLRSPYTSLTNWDAHVQYSDNAARSKSGRNQRQ